VKYRRVGLAIYRMAPTTLIAVLETDELAATYIRRLNAQQAQATDPPAQADPPPSVDRDPAQDRG
jgi:hypothetical protein